MFIYSERLQLTKSLKRYFNYIFVIELVQYKNEVGIESDSVIFIDESLELDGDFIAQLALKKPRIFVFGIQEKFGDGYINLLNLPKFSKNILFEFINKKGTFSSLLYVKDLRKKVSSFFKAHGEVSLFKLLNSTIQTLESVFHALSCESAAPDDPDIIKTWELGSKNWNDFKSRINKYKEYLITSGFCNEVKEIEENTNNFEKFFNAVIVSGFRGNVVKNNDIINMNFTYLKNIDSIFLTIKNKVDEYAKG